MGNDLASETSAAKPIHSRLSVGQHPFTWQGQGHPAHGVAMTVLMEARAMKAEAMMVKRIFELYKENFVGMEKSAQTERGIYTSSKGPGPHPCDYFGLGEQYGRILDNRLDTWVASLEHCLNLTDWIARGEPCNKIWRLQRSL